LQNRPEKKTNIYMPIYKMSVRCTTVGEFFLEAESEEEAIAAAHNISAEAYKEEVEDTDYDVEGQATPNDLTGRIINQPNDENGDPRWYYYGQPPG
jgi:hypothetical protein